MTAAATGPAPAARPALPVTGARSAVSARTVIRVAADRRGVPVLSELRCQIPLVARLTTDPARTDGRAGLTLHLVSAGAGPLAGDHLELDLHIGPGTRLTLRSVAATVALPGRGGGPSQLLVRATVEAGGLLEYRPEPTVAAAGCDHRMRAEIRLAAGAAVVWREELLLGRYGEPGGSVSTAIRVDELNPTEVPAGSARPDTPTGADSPPVPAAPRAAAGRDGLRPVLRHQLSAGPTAPGATGPAVLGDARAVGAVLVARGGGPAGLSTPAWAETGVAVLPLAGPGVLVTALAADAVTLRKRLAAGENQVKKSSYEYS